eukprot:CAMPEP_0201717692 /NCGR_PEP_ID=MMETSP0593-20130828/3380_1 /ASSEMBLY_ACC=CAM_ASM_000672 /TAXON_ID=267983 /ORGANISM="Skeletonema japonicum, Strain CCMP2506" /LENGTH=277 /DNA_ID=CAMNT_0048207811 /DNA_START=80 /DNA_END=909 /DNA_ORIENTATION=+
MGDLEDKFLKQNVPGRYSSWTDDADDKNCLRHQESCCNSDDDDDSEDDEFYFRDLPPTAAASSTQQQAPMPLRSKGNTGVKGVIADYKEAQREEQLQKVEDHLENMQRLQRATQPSIRPRDNASDERNIQQIDNDSDDDEDDEFLKKFRMQRIAQLKETSNALPTFGTLSSKSPEDYVQLVDDMDPRVFVIVHLYEPSIAASRMLHSALDKVAQIMEHAKFIEVNALDANPNLDLICLPAILIYKRGELVNNMIKFTDGLPKAFTVEDVTEALEVAG